MRVRKISKKGTLKQKGTTKTDPTILIEKLNFNGNKVTQLDDDLLDKKEATDFQNILNDLLDKQINNLQTFNEEKIHLAISIGKILKESTQNWEESKERDYLNSLIDNIETFPYVRNEIPSRCENVQS